ncbi:MAG TPA: hypothetical protein VN442_23890 [Bryobacteraceae bacterium]|nr:hypothetical protein [Bryobacteraceae bacterium]
MPPKTSLVLLFCLVYACPAADRIVPGKLLVDPPTLENLGFRWYVKGDDNRNAKVEVQYRRKGEPGWRAALPLLRVYRELVNQDFDPYRVGNLFAGSVLFLEPGTAYEVRLAMSDPEGGGETRTVTAETRREPRALVGGRTLDVYPAGFTGKRTPRSYVGLMAAYAVARPGDRLLLHAGIYKGPFTLARSGAPDKPIAIQAAGDGEAVLEGPGHGGDLLNVQRANHLIFEDLTLRHAKHAILAGVKGEPGASGLVVRRCRISDAIWGVTTTSEYSSGWYIADNVLTGTNPTWYPRPEKTYMSPSHTGINVYGRGHVVAHNRISRFSDGIAPANFGPPRDELELQPVAVDIHDNDVSFAQDDCIETDYGAHNFRVYRNRCYNAHTGISVQPFYGGPVYLIRNEVYGVTALNFKVHNYSAGVVAYHNTVASAGSGFKSFERWQNGHFRNNLFLGGRGLAMDTGTLTRYSTLDYNGYRRNAPGDLIRWFDGVKRALYPTLEAFRTATRHERHGIMVDYDLFLKAEPPRAGVTVDPAAYDLRLRNGAAAVDAGTPLAGINDGSAGRAPDLGCYELGAAPPRYGPRAR